MVWLGRVVRGLAGWLDLVVMTAALWLAAWLPRSWTAPWFRRVFRVWCRCFVRALDVELRLHEHQRGALPSRYLLIANHPSAFEDVGMPALFPVDALAKSEVREWWLAGRIAERAGTLFVERASKRSRRRAADQVVAALARGRSVVLYPEGGCQGRRLASRFHYGAFEIARRAGVPVVPVFIHYEAQAAFEWAGQSLPRKIVEIARAPNRRANYHVFEPFDPADYADAVAFHDAVYAQYQRWQERFLL